MKFLVDTAVTADIERAFASLPLTGVTTNPTLLSRAGGDPVERLYRIRAIIGNTSELHVQLTVPTDCVEAAVAEGRAIDAAFGDRVCIKVPISESGLRVTEALASSGIAVTETAIFSPAEALLAARAGAKYVAPYVNRLIAAGEDGIGCVREIRAIFDRHGIGCEILAASFHDVGQLADAASAGAHNATVPFALLLEATRHPLTDKAILGFAADWRDAYGDATLLDMLGGE